MKYTFTKNQLRKLLIEAYSTGWADLRVKKILSPTKSTDRIIKKIAASNQLK